MPSSETYSTKYLCFMGMLLAWLSFCSINLDCFAYFDSVLSHIALPFTELVDPIEDSIEGAHDQSSVELQVL